MARVPGVVGGIHNLDNKRMQAESGRIYALARTLAKVARIVTGNPEVTVSMSDAGKTRAPAWNDGKNITINLSQFRSLGSKETLMRMIGMNHHEICHVLYTPHLDSALGQWRARHQHMKDAFNWLEDQRIETFYTSRYRPSRRYFTALVAEFYADNEDMWPTGYFLVYGRKFLPRDIRDGFRERFEGTEDQRRRGEGIIDEYRLLSLTTWRSQHRATALIEAFYNLLQELDANQDIDHDSQEDRVSSSPPSSKDSEQDSAKAAKDSAEQEEIEKDEDADGSGFWDELDDEIEDLDDEGSDDGEDGDEEDGEEDSGGREDSEDEAADDSDDGGNGDSGEDDYDDGGDEGASSASGDSDEHDGGEQGGEFDADENRGVGGDGEKYDVDLEEVLDEALTAVIDSRTIQNDVASVRSAMYDPMDVHIDELDMEPCYEVAVLEHVANAKQETAKVFEQLHGDIQPGWRYGSDHGRLNVGRAMQSDDLDDIFDEWEEGREMDSGLELVIALDVSISMEGRPMADAANAMWIIKSACEELDSSVSVISFDEGTMLYYGRDEKAGDKVRVPRALGGDTQPLEALKVANRVLSQTAKPIKMLAVITDGDWRGPIELLTYIPEIDAYRMCIGIGQSMRYAGFPNANNNSLAEHFNLVRGVSHADEIAPVMQEAVNDLMRNLLLGG